MNIILIGTGTWSEKSHLKGIVELKKDKFDCKVSAIIDIQNPYINKGKKNLNSILKADSPTWIDASKGDEFVTKSFKKYIKENKIDLLIISTSPTYHYFYIMLGLKAEINIICDKPLCVVKNSSISLSAAKKINAELVEIQNIYKSIKAKNEKFIFATLLRRRALEPFTSIAAELKSVYEETGERIKYLNILVNSGIHRYPVEFLKGGAHGYLDGIGSLSHSSVHYIDLIAWYLTAAKGDIEFINVKLPYIYRVEDYLRSKDYLALKKLLESKKSNIDDDIELTTGVLGSEMDFRFDLELMDLNMNILGLASYTSNHTTFTPRINKYGKEILDPANLKGGGRMSHFYMDIHQGSLQNWQVIKNDIVFKDYTIQSVNRKHPKISNGSDHIKKEYKNAYEAQFTPSELLKVTLRYLKEGDSKENNLNLITKYEDQILTNKLYAKFYELIAAEYEQRNDKRVKVDSLIKI